NGAFLEYTLLSDQRFAGFTAFVSDTSSDALLANRKAIKALSSTLAADPVMLQGAASLHGLAVVMAWFTVLIEGWIAASFLVPNAFRLSRTRDLALNAFMFT